jgi:hypothetical protein
MSLSYTASASLILAAWCVACHEPSKNDVRDVDSATALVCGSTQWAAVAFAPVDLGPEARQHVPYVPGPAGREVVVRQAQWDTVWHRLAGTLPVPRANLTDSIVIIVATPEFSDGPHRLTIDGIRRCRASGEIVVSLRRHDPDRRYDYGDRTILAVSLARRTIASAPIRFPDLPHARE